MDTPTETELWRFVPPEEKLELLARAQASGVLSIAYTVIVASTIAVGLKASWLLWTSLICSPFIFQFAAGKSWRGIRPRAMLEYLAARSAARRFAFAARATELTPQLIFKAHLEEIFSNDQRMEEIQAEFENSRTVPVWVVLFTDCFVFMTEKPGGAEQKLAHLLHDPLEISDLMGAKSEDTAHAKKLKITVGSRRGLSRSFFLSSRYSAALYVFKKLCMKQQSVAALLFSEHEEKVRKLAQQEAPADPDDFLFKQHL